MGVERDEDNVRIREELKDRLGSSNINLAVSQEQPERETGVLEEDIKTMTSKWNEIYYEGQIPGN